MDKITEKLLRATEISAKLTVLNNIGKQINKEIKLLQKEAKKEGLL